MVSLIMKANLNYSSESFILISMIFKYLSPCRVFKTGQNLSIILLHEAHVSITLNCFENPSPVQCLTDFIYLFVCTLIDSICLKKRTLHDSV